jgi:hypothetical protein
MERDRRRTDYLHAAHRSAVVTASGSQSKGLGFESPPSPGTFIEVGATGICVDILQQIKAVVYFYFWCFAAHKFYK